MARGLTLAGERVAGAAATATAAGLAARIAAVDPAIMVVTEGATVRLTAPGLTARVFGSRRHGPDLRLAGLMGGRT